MVREPERDGQGLLWKGLLAVAVLLPLTFNPYAALPFEPVKVAVFRAAVTVMLLVATLQFVKATPPPARSKRSFLVEQFKTLSRSPLVLTLFLYGLVHVIATFNSLYPGVSFWGASDRHGTFTLVCSLIFVFLAIRVLRSEQQVANTISAILFGSVPVVIYGLVQYAGLDPLSWVTDGASPVLSTMGRSNFLGAYLALIIPLTISQILIRDSGRASWSLSVMLALQAVVLFLTLSRAAWLGAVAGSLVLTGLLAYRQRQRRLALAAMVILLLGIGGYNVDLHAAVQEQAAAPVVSAGPTFSELRQASNEQRIAIWQQTLKLIPRRWLLGHGPETFLIEYGESYSPETGAIFTDDPHNLLLQEMFSTGIIGTLLLVAIIYQCYRFMLRFVFERQHDSRRVIIMAALTGSLTAYLVQAQFAPDVIVPSVFFWLVVAMALAIRRLPADVT